MAAMHLLNNAHYFGRVLVFVGLMTASTNTAIAGQSNGTVSEMLSVLGQRADCYYTIELIGDENLMGEKLVVGDDITTAEGTVDFLKARLSPNFDVSLLAGVPTMVRIRSKGCDSIPRYWMDQKATIEYSGTPSGCVGQWISQLTGVEPQTQFYTPDFENLDITTQIKLSVQGGTIHEALSHSIPLKDYAHVVWVARTVEHNGKQVVRVDFGGKLKTPRLTIFVGDTKAIKGASFPAVAQIDNVSNVPIMLYRWAQFEPIFSFPQMSADDVANESHRSQRMRPTQPQPELIVHIRQKVGYYEEFRGILPPVEITREQGTIAAGDTRFIRCDVPEKELLAGECILQLGILVNGNEVAVSNSITVNCAPAGISK